MSLQNGPMIRTIGMTATFPQCKAVSVPPVSIEWKRAFLGFPKDRTSTKDGMLRISKLQVKDEGYYQCTSRRTR